MYCLHDIALCYCTCMIVHVNHLMKSSSSSSSNSSSTLVAVVLLSCNSSTKLQ